MSPDRGALPPVPAQYGALDGGPPRVESAPRPARRRGSPLDRLARAIGADQADAADYTGIAAPPSPDGDLAPAAEPAPDATNPDNGNGGTASPDIAHPDPTDPDGIPAMTRAASASAPPPVPSPRSPYQPPPSGTPETGPGSEPAAYQAPAGFPPSPVRPRPLEEPDDHPRPGWRDRQRARREERAAQAVDGTEEYLEGRRFRRETVRVVRGRRSRRIIRRVDTWTVLKVSLVFYLCALIVVLISGVVLWNVAQAFNFTHDIEKSIKTLFGYSTFTLHPGPMFEYTALGGVILAVVGTLVNVLAAMVYNLIADVIGGVQVIVVTEEM